MRHPVKSKVQWELLPRNTLDRMAAEWDQALLQSQDYTVFQSFGWGEYKRNSGWQPWRWLARNDGHIVAMAQILVKALPARIKIGWAPGAPVLLFPHSKTKEIPVVMQSLLDTLSCRHRRLGLRLDSYLPYQAEFSYALSQSLFRPILPVNTGYSTTLDLSQSYEALMHKIKPRHRSYVRQAMQEDIEWKVGQDESSKHDFVRLHHEMTQQKGLEVLQTSIEDVTALRTALGNSATFLTGYLNGEAVTSYLILCFGKKAFYLLAATGKQGRAKRASYALVNYLVEYLQQQGITEFDFGGLDPRSPAAAGVNQFKRGFGGELIEYLGEWEWASQSWLRWALNLAVWYRGSQL